MPTNRKGRRLEGPGNYWKSQVQPGRPGAGLIAPAATANRAVACSGTCATIPPSPHVIGPNAEWAAFRADSRRLAVVWPDSVGLFAIPSGRELKRLKAGPSARRAAFHPDGRRLAVAAGARITVLNTDDAKTDDGVIVADSTVWSLAWSATAGCSPPAPENHRVFVFQLSNSSAHLHSGRPSKHGDRARFHPRHQPAALHGLGQPDLRLGPGQWIPTCAR